MKYIMAILGAAFFLNLASPPLDFGYAASFLFLPLFPIFESSGVKRFFTGWAAGFLAQALAYYWIFYTVRDFGGQNTAISLTGAILFQMYQGLDLGLWLLLTPILFKRTAPGLLPFGAAGFFVILQAWIFPYVFPWDYGSLFANAPGISGTAALWSSRGIAFFMIVLQGLAWVHRSHLKKKLPIIMAVFILFLSGHFFKTRPETEIWRIGVVQPNLVRWAKQGGMTYNDIFQAHLRPALSMVRDNLDLIIWPESAMAFELGRFPHYQTELRRLVRDSGAALITGTISRNEEGGYQNEIYMYTPENNEPQVYTKQKLVMFSEQLPWIFSWARHFDASIGAFRPGTENKPFAYRNISITPLVCFEGLFPEYAGRNASNLIVNLTNDAWFGDTKASSQHLQQIRLRTVEQQIPLVRATNSGITCWIDSSGVIRGAGSLYEPETFIYEVPIPQETSQRFSRRGNALVIIFASLCIVWAMAAHFRPHDILGDAQ